MRLLRNKINPLQFQLMLERFLIKRFQKATAEFPVNFHCHAENLPVKSLCSNSILIRVIRGYICEPFRLRHNLA